MRKAAQEKLRNIVLILRHSPRLKFHPENAYIVKYCFKYSSFSQIVRCLLFTEQGEFLYNEKRLIGQLTGFQQGNFMAESESSLVHQRKSWIAHGQ